MRVTVFRSNRFKRSAEPSNSNHFQDAIRFLEAQGQRGRQRGILREGVYAINLALFVVITEERVFSGPVRESADRYESWKAQLASMRAFDPVVIGTGAGGQSHFRANVADTSASEARLRRRRWPQKRPTSIRTSIPSAW